MILIDVEQKQTAVATASFSLRLFAERLIDRSWQLHCCSSEIKLSVLTFHEFFPVLRDTTKDKHEAEVSTSSCR